MATSYSSRTIPTTSHNWRDPVGRKYLATESWQIITTEDWKWLIAVDSSNTSYTTNRWYTAVILWDIVWTLWGMTWTLADYYTWILPTNYTWRIIP
jgi:hypothetical protein